MDDEAYECPECLQKIPGADAIKKRREAEKKEKKKKIIKNISVGVLAVAFITGLTVLVSVLNSSSSKKYMKPVNNLIKGCTANDYDRYISAYPEMYQQMFSEQFAYLIMDGIMPSTPEKVHTADLLYHDEYYRSLARKYGTDFDITYNVYSEKQLTPGELQSFFEEYYSFDPENLADDVFSDGYELAIAFNVKGNLGSKTITSKQLRLININGEWRLMDYIDFHGEEEEETTLQNMR